jgi:hypothetical protein
MDYKKTFDSLSSFFDIGSCDAPDNIEELYAPDESIGWSNHPNFSKSVSEGMILYCSTEDGKAKRKRMAEEFRDNPKFYIRGHKGHKHSEEAKRKISQSKKLMRRMSDQDKKVIVENYNNGIGAYTTAKQIGFTAPAIRRYIKNNHL